MQFFRLGSMYSPFINLIRPCCTLDRRDRLEIRVGRPRHEFSRFQERKAGISCNIACLARFLSWLARFLFLSTLDDRMRHLHTGEQQRSGSGFASVVDMTGIAALTARRCRKPLRRRPRWMSISRMPPRRAEHATFSLFQATDEEFDAIFPGEAQDMELIEDFTERVGEGQALRILLPVWERPILKRDAQGIHGTLYYEYADRRRYLPASKRE